jgi:hypothetical protein
LSDEIRARVRLEIPALKIRSLEIHARIESTVIPGCGQSAQARYRSALE